MSTTELKTDLTNKIIRLKQDLTCAKDFYGKSIDEDGTATELLLQLANAVKSPHVKIVACADYTPWAMTETDYSDYMNYKQVDKSEDLLLYWFIDRLNRYASELYECTGDTYDLVISMTRHIHNMILFNIADVDSYMKEKSEATLDINDGLADYVRKVVSNEYDIDQLLDLSKALLQHYLDNPSDFFIV